MNFCSLRTKPKINQNKRQSSVRQVMIASFADGFYARAGFQAWLPASPSYDIKRFHQEILDLFLPIGGIFFLDSADGVYFRTLPTEYGECFRAPTDVEQKEVEQTSILND